MNNSEVSKIQPGTQVMAVVAGRVIVAVVDEDLGGGKFRIHRAGGEKIFTCSKVSLPKPIPTAARETGPVMKVKKPSLVSAALAILADGGAYSAKELVNIAIERRLWPPSGAATPEQTLYSAIFREIKTSEHPRFRKSSEKGKFEAVR